MPLNDSPIENDSKQDCVEGGGPRNALHDNAGDGVGAGDAVGDGVGVADGEGVGVGVQVCQRSKYQFSLGVGVGSGALATSATLIAGVKAMTHVSRSENIAVVCVVINYSLERTAPHPGAASTNAAPLSVMRHSGEM